ncbi:MAG: BMA_0021/BMA_0022 family TOMM bacteriocin [Pseudomonadota bacterium]
MLSNKMPSSGNPLMDLRIAVLKTIAMTWKDDFAKTEIKLREIFKSMPCLELRKWLEESINYAMPFVGFGIQFLQPEARWNSYGNNQWTKHKFETIEITIPIIPADFCGRLDEYQKSEKLIEYYSHFPTIFGASSTKNVNGNPAKFASSTFNYAPGGDNYDLGVSQDSFLGFSAAFLNLITAIWENESLLNELDYNRYKTRKSLSAIDDQAYFDHVNYIFSHYFNYEFPWRFNLKLVTPIAGEEFWVSNDGVNWKWNDANIIRNIVYIEIPYAPDAKNQSVSLALAKYNATGPAYPFTCS